MIVAILLLCWCCGVVGAELSQDWGTRKRSCNKLCADSADKAHTQCRSGIGNSRGTGSQHHDFGTQGNVLSTSTHQAQCLHMLHIHTLGAIFALMQADTLPLTKAVLSKSCHRRAIQKVLYSPD